MNEQNVWVFKADGTIQCSGASEITLETMRKELEEILGPDNVLQMKKEYMTVFALCGAPTGAVNTYELTPKGWDLLECGAVGDLGFRRWAPHLALARAGGGGEIPTPFSSRPVLQLLTGLVIFDDNPFCRDGVEYALSHRSDDDSRSVTRLKAANEKVAEIFGKAVGTRQRVSVVGCKMRGIEPGCGYMDCIYAGPEIKPEDFAAKLF